MQYIPCKVNITRRWTFVLQEWIYRLWKGGGGWYCSCKWSFKQIWFKLAILFHNFLQILMPTTSRQLSSTHRTKCVCETNIPDNGQFHGSDQKDRYFEIWKILSQEMLGCNLKSLKSIFFFSRNHGQCHSNSRNWSNAKRFDTNRKVLSQMIYVKYDNSSNYC